MALLEVVRYGHSALRKKSRLYTPEEIEPKFIVDMIETMRKEDGVGLAANQVGVDRQLFVAVDPQDHKVYVLLNPKIVAHSEKTVTNSEGCLSLPGLQAKVDRYEKIVMRAMDPEENLIEITARGLFARVLQHEIDHINGILYIDKADMSTLVWLKEKEGNNEVEKEPTTLSVVKERFAQIFHDNNHNLIFDVA